MTMLEAVKEAAYRDPESAYRAAGYQGDLTPDGPRRVKGLCPIHQERTPSFKVHVDGELRGCWSCYGACDCTGDIINFYMLFERISDTRKAVMELADRLGVNGDARPAQVRPVAKAKATVPPPIAEEIADRLHRALMDSPERLRLLTEKKGLPRDIVERARLGWDEATKRYMIPIPVVDGREGFADIRKYLPGAPKDSEKMLAWETGRGYTKVYPWMWVCDDEELVLTEGEIDALNLIGRDIPAFSSTNGASKWPAEPPDLSGKVIWVCGDADAAGVKHNETMPGKLYAAGAEEVRVIEWPEDAPKGFDVSDFFAQGGTADDFRDLMESAEVIAPTAPQHDAADGSPDAYFDGNRFVIKRLADQIRDEIPVVKMGGDLHVYEGGVYVSRGEAAIRQRTQSLLGEQHSKRRADEVVYDIETAARLADEDVNRNCDLVNMRNGLLDWRTGELHPHKPGHVSTVQLPIIYDPSAHGSGALDQYLQSTLADGDGHPDNVVLVEEFVGYCLVPSTRFEKAFCAVGSGKNGKSVFLHLLGALLGTGNVSNIPLQEIAVHKFKRADLFGCLANLFADLDNKALRSTAYFKALVSGDVIDGERKYGHPFSFRSFARLVFSANQMPVADDPSFAYHRRWVILPFPNTFDGDACDPDLLAKLTEPAELSHFLNRAIAGLRRLWERGEFTVPPSTADALAAYRLATDSVAAFVEDMCTVHSEARVKKQAMFDAYVRWCEQSKLRSVPQSDFNTRLENDHAARPRSLRWGDGKRVRSWEGIGLSCDREPVTAPLPTSDRPVAGLLPGNGLDTAR